MDHGYMRNVRLSGQAQKAKRRGRSKSAPGMIVGAIPGRGCDPGPGAAKTAEAKDRMREEEAMRTLRVSLSTSYKSRHVR